MANNSMIADLLKTPRQVREEEQAQLQAKGIAAQNAILAQGTPSKSLFGGAMQGLAGQYASYVPESVDVAKRNLMQLGGMDPRSAKEMEAVENRNISRVAMSGDLTKMKDLREALMRNPNANPQAIAALTTRINAEEKRLADLEDKDDDFNKLTAGDKEAIREASRAHRMARLESRKALDLADKYERERPTGGIFGDIYSNFKEFVGGTDALNMMRTQFNGIIMSGVLDSLPPGPATDKDITNAQKGFPNERFSADQITSFLIGFAKAKRIEAGYQKFYAEWLSDHNGNSAGVEDAWAKHFEENKELYWTDDSESEDKDNKDTGSTNGAGSSTFSAELVPPGTEGMVTGDVVNQVQTQPGASPGTMTVPSMYRPRTRGGVTQRNR